MFTARQTVPHAVKKGDKLSRSDQQIRRDRIIGIVITVVLAALMALMIWLASLGVGGSENMHDYWPTMP